MRVRSRCAIWTAWPIDMTFDWTFLARDLAAHLVAASGVENAERILQDAQRDAARLVAPADFWLRVGREYEKRSLGLDAQLNDHVVAMLRRLRDGSEYGQ